MVGKMLGNDLSPSSPAQSSGMYLDLERLRVLDGSKNTVHCVSLR